MHLVRTQNFLTINLKNYYFLPPDTRNMWKILRTYQMNNAFLYNEGFELSSVKEVN